MKQVISGLLVAFSLIALTGCNIITEEYEQTYTLDATDLIAIQINHDEGDVRITGGESDQISVTATFTAWSDESAEHAQDFIKENLTVDLSADGSQAVLKTSVKRGNNPEQGFIHLNIEMPNNLVVDYRQNEGQLRVESMRSDLNIQHGTNHLFLNDIIGNIKITDGAGDATLEEVVGDMIINNNAGITKLVQSVGSVNLIAGSGPVDIEEHEGDITVRSGVGNININQVIGNVTILESRDGTVNIDNIIGTISQP